MENNLDAYISSKEADNLSNSEYVNSGTYIVKTKTNKIDDYNNIEADKINFKNILPENTFIMSKEKAALRHNINDYDNNLKKGIEQVYFDSNKVSNKYQDVIVWSPEEIFQIIEKYNNDLIIFVATARYEKEIINELIAYGIQPQFYDGISSIFKWSYNRYYMDR